MTNTQETIQDYGSGLNWTLNLVIFSLGVSALIKMLTPEGRFVDSFIVSMSYGLPIVLNLRLLLRRFRHYSLLRLMLLATPAGLIIGTAVGYTLCRQRLGAHAPPLWQYFLIGLLFTSAAIWLFHSRIHARLARSALQAEQLRRLEQEKLLTQAQLHTLQSQIEPHFIFNALANVQGLIQADPTAARRLLERITDLLRHTLARNPERRLTLGHEVELIEEYLSIQQLRLGKRLRYRVDVPPPLRELPFPALLLQPLVENAVKHGIEPSIEGGDIHVVGRSESGKLVIEVHDNGLGFGDGGSAPGIGLRNVRERLANLHGTGAVLVLKENSPRGINAVLELPHEPAA